MPTKSRPAAPLRAYLDGLLARFDRRYVESDPVAFVHRYADPADQEIVGLIAAGLAFGNVKTILKDSATVLAEMGESPLGFVRRFGSASAGGGAGGRRAFDGFKHRWIGPPAVRALVTFQARAVSEAGSLGGFVRALDDPSERTVEGLLVRLAASARRLGGPAVAPFFPSPESKSACKRLNLWLRWMTRPKDGIDLGLWTFLDPARLVIPLDTHVQALGKRLGLTRRRTSGWAMAEEITDALRRLDPRDPLKYDFALCHAGMERGPLSEDLPRPRPERKALGAPVSPRSYEATHL